MRENTAAETTQMTQREATDDPRPFGDAPNPGVSSDGRGPHGDQPSNLASPEEFFARLTERSDVRDFLKRLADR